MNDELQAAIDHLETYGYCLLENRIPAALTQSLAVRCLELHQMPKNQEYIHGDEFYQTLFGMPNLDDRVWDFAAHPDTLAIARHFLGDRCRAVEACSKQTLPGAPAQHLHVDSAGYFKDVPDFPWMINTIWMLTDFTIENGATGIVPLSHRSRLKSPPASIGHDSPLIKPITGPAGSVMLWHAGAFHQARANTSDQTRIGLNIAYYPRWLNNWFEGGHQPIWPETFARMPEAIQAIWPERQARRRADAYETR
jgi:hypothetical protein